MKNIKIWFLCMGVISLTGCSEDFLERSNPNEQTSENFWKTEQDLIDGLNAAYRPLRFNGCYSRWLHVLYVSRSDEGYSESPNADFVSYSNFLTRNNDNTEGVFFPWLDMYKGIFWANQVLDNAPLIDINAALRERMMGEAYFLRGVHYLNLAGTYGRGPLTLTSFAEAGIPIAEKEQLYRQAKADFDEAQKRLPSYYEDSKDIGRITRGAALGMYVKACAQLHEWSEVESACRSIFALKNAGGGDLYSLVAAYKDNFTESNENNAESLFEIQFGKGTLAGVDLGCQRVKFLGLPGTGLTENTLAWDDATAHNNVKTELEMEQTVGNQPDPRLKHTLFYSDPANPNERFYPSGSAAGKTWNELVATAKRSKVYWKKYTNYETQNYEDYNSGINLRVLRLADIYLMYAEALNELGRTSEAYEYINYVRTRAELPNLQNSSVFQDIGNDQNKMRLHLRHERTCELAGESWRWFDLERWGLFENEEGKSWLKNRDDEFNNFTIGKSDRFPIPYREIGLVQGLRQNDGY